MSTYAAILVLLKDFYIFAFRQRRKEGEREREKHYHVRDTSSGCLLHTPNQGLGPKPRHVP